MTNWEKWKEGFTPQDLVDMLLQDWNLIDKIRREWVATTSEKFLTWANAEAEEEEK